MSRSVFLSAGGDPFIASLVLKLWKDRWYEEVDEVIVSYNNHAGVPQEVTSEFLSRTNFDKKVSIIYHPRGIGNGRPITEMAMISEANLVLLLEDDGFIYTPGVVSKQFQQIESDLTDVVGSPRGSCGQEIWDASQKRYNLDYSGYGDVGPNFWPNFFFCKRSDLIRTDMNFGSKSFQAGEYSKELDYTFQGVNHGDTFVWACMQLRALGLRFASVPQFHAMPNEIEEYERKDANWRSGKPFWIHGGSLSAGWGGYLSGRVPDMPTDLNKMEIETRIAFWQIALDMTIGYDSFRSVYQHGIDQLTEQGKLERSRIAKKIHIYRELMGV